MNRIKRIAAAAALIGALATGEAATAGDHGGGHGRGGGWAREGGGEWRGDRGGPDRGGRDQGGRDRGGHDRGGDRWDGPRGRWSEGPPRGAYAPPGMPVYPQRGGPPGYGMRRGARIPPQYRDAEVPDYGRHRLRPPPPGFAWVRMGGRYMLVSRATGQIFDVIGD